MATRWRVHDKATPTNEPQKGIASRNAKRRENYRESSSGWEEAMRNSKRGSPFIGRVQ